MVANFSAVCHFTYQIMFIFSLLLTKKVVENVALTDSQYVKPPLFTSAIICIALMDRFPISIR